MNERERIEFIISVYGLSPSLFADKTGIPRASVSHILSGRNKPSLEILQKVAKVFPNVDLNWLVLGVGKAPSVADILPENEEVKPEEVTGSLFPNDYIAPREGNNEVVKTPVVRNSSIKEESVRVARSTPAKIATVERQAKKSVASRSANENVRFIKEVRVFYSDGTYEILYPEK